MVKQLLTLTALEFGNDMTVMERFDLTDLIQRRHWHRRSILLQQKEIQVVFEQIRSLYVSGQTNLRSRRSSPTT